MPHTLAIRHVPFEDLGLLGPLLAERGHAIEYVEAPTANLTALDPLAADLLVVLGGPIGVYENDRYPFIDAEIGLLSRRLAAGRPTLGICLGSQMMAKALGARVYPSGVKEIGWAQLELTAEGSASSLRHLRGTPVLHWHGDTFDIPEGAVRLASTPLCRNQAFSAGPHALGLQFHAEAAGRALEAWFVGHACEIGATSGVSVAQLRNDTLRHSSLLEQNGRAFFREWLSTAGA
ncbi:MAG TPA: glutamine amidotransferase [Gammaproteobacteria bacterium]|nr:glutamine amidotransferase [Gammaproteobacteria bacterium]